MSRYRCLGKGKGLKLPLSGNGDDRDSASKIMACLPQDFSQVQIGNTMVLYRADEHRILELLRNLALDLIVPVAQRGSRKGIGRRYRAKVREVKGLCSQALTLGNDVVVLDRAIAQTNDILGPMRNLFNFDPPELQRCKDLRFKLQERVVLTQLMRELVGKNEGNPAAVYPELGCAIVRANAIRDIPGTAADMDVEQQCRDMLRSCAGPRLDPLAEEALWLLKRDAMVDVLAQADDVGYSSGDLEEIRGKLGLGEEQFVKLQLKKGIELGDPDRIINREIRLKEL